MSFFRALAVPHHQPLSVTRVCSACPTVTAADWMGQDVPVILSRSPALYMSMKQVEVRVARVWDSMGVAPKQQPFVLADRSLSSHSHCLSAHVQINWMGKVTMGRESSGATVTGGDATGMPEHWCVPRTKPSVSSPCLALPCLALPCLALPCLALPCLALPCGASPVASSALAPPDGFPRYVWFAAWSSRGRSCLVHWRRCVTR